MNRVREMRRSKGWSLARLARESSVSKSHLSSVERGKKEPTISVARRVARALGAELDQVFPVAQEDADRNVADRDGSPASSRGTGRDEAPRHQPGEVDTP